VASSTHDLLQLSTRVALRSHNSQGYITLFIPTYLLVHSLTLRIPQAQVESRSEHFFSAIHLNRKLDDFLIVTIVLVASYNVPRPTPKLTRPSTRFARRQALLFSILNR
jgi:hypothetical protein